MELYHEENLISLTGRGKLILTLQSTSQGFLSRGVVILNSQQYTFYLLHMLFVAIVHSYI